MIGTQISHFKILSKIGEGGMGVVYRAEDLDLGRVVAIKVLPPHLVGDEDRRARFVAEARTAAAVTHPHIATVHEIGQSADVIFIAMEMVEGRSLRKLIDEGGLTIKNAVRLATEMAEGLAAAHGAQIAHRDLKPDNVVVGPDGHVKILDFGLARLLSGPNGATRWSHITTEPGDPTDPGATPDAVAPASTQTGELDDPVVPNDKAVTLPVGDKKVLGTPAYMSPEQARGLEVDYRSDIFSFGCTLYEMITGVPPFRGPTPTSTIADIIHTEPPSAVSVNVETPSSVQWILDKCLEKNPESRYQDTRDLVVDLHHLYPETGTQTVSHSGESDAWPTRKTQEVDRRPIWLRPLPVAVAVLIALLGVTGTLLLRSERALPLAEENSLAVFPFENLGNPDDPDRLGEILQELLITDLSGLEPLNVFSSQRLSDIERQLERDGETGSAKDVASAVATRAGAERMVTGKLSQLGERWILTTQLTDVSTGTVLKSKRINGNDLYGMVDQLTSEIHGEFAMPVEVADASIKDKTSTSMEAYKHYLEGKDYLDANQFNEAVQELTEAVQIDPSFGQAYYQLGLATWWLYSDTGAGRDHIEHLLENELYATAKEKDMAEAMLLLVDNRWSEAAPVFEKLATSYSDDKYAWYGLGESQYHSPSSNSNDRARESFERAVALDPEFLLPYRHIFDTLWASERFEEATARADQLLELEPNSALWHRYKVGSLAITADIAGTERALQVALETNGSAEDRRELYKMVAFQLASLDYVPLAEEYTRMAVDADPSHNDPALIRSLLGYLRAQRKHDEYEERVRELMAKDPGSLAYQANLLDVKFHKHEFEVAFKTAQQLCAEQPGHPRWYQYLARAAVHIGSDDLLEQVIATAARHNDSADEERRLFSSIAYAYGSMGNHNQAKAYFERAIGTDADVEYLDEIIGIGFQELRRGRFDVAEEWFKRARKLAPENPRPLFLTALLDVERGNVQTALRRFDEAIALLPPSKLFPFLSASLHIFTGNTKAIEPLLAPEKVSLAAEYQKWRVLYNEPGDIPLGIAWAYLLSGDLDSARLTFEHGLSAEMGQRDQAPYNGLGWTLLNAERYDEAEAAFRAGLDVGYGHGDLLRGIGIARLLKGDAAGAERYARKASESDQADIENLRLLAFALAEQGRHADALPIAERTVAMDSSRTSFELLAWVLVDGELDVERGIEVARQAQALPNRFLDVGKKLSHRACADHSLGLAYFKKGKSRDAEQHLKKAAALQPNRACIQDHLENVHDARSGTR
jgi:serine/threonine-protein kinase